jgi:hypothetical protein
MSALAIPLRSISSCFEALIPSMLATCARDGVPNVMALSDIYIVDENHVAVSRQFFRKTHENLAQNPRAQLVVTDPYSQNTYRLAVRLDREETAGPLFELMKTRLQAVASMTGMTGVFKLAASMVFEVLAIEQVAGTLRDDVPATLPEESALSAIDAGTEMRALRRVSDCLRGADDLETLLDRVLATLDEVLGFAHSMILLLDERGERLYAIASRGYSESGIGAEIRIGEGVIGTVAQTRRLLRVPSVSYAKRYAPRAIRIAAPTRSRCPASPTPRASWRFRWWSRTSCSACWRSRAAACSSTAIARRRSWMWWRGKWPSRSAICSAAPTRASARRPPRARRAPDARESSSSIRPTTACSSTASI